MSFAETYAEWLIIRIVHEYYGIHRVPLALSPTSETQRFLKRHGILFRSSRTNEWRLLAPVGKPVPAADQTTLVFVLKPLDGEFYYCTGEVGSGTGFTLSETRKPGVWRELTVTAEISEAAGGQRLEVRIPATERYWEYLLISGNESEKPVPELCDEQEKLTFRYAGPVELPDASLAFRFVTTDRVPLRHSYPYRLSLWEVRKAGRRLLSDTVPFPDPSEWSVTGAEDTIAVYCYY